MKTELHGLSISVYTWIVRATLFKKKVDYDLIEVNPFSEKGHPAHPFGKVPLLVHGDFRIYETSAITKYIDAAFEGPELQASDVYQCSRSNQIVSIIDNYAYWPLVRQVAAHGFFNKVYNLEINRSELNLGLKLAPNILSALDQLVLEQGLLKDGKISLADVHLGPMISYFALVPEGAELLGSYDRLSRWWEEISVQKCIEETKPRLPKLI